MYMVSKLSKESLSFISTNMSAGKTRSISFSIATAYVLSSACSLPSGDVKDMDVYFNTNHEVQILNEMDMLNSFCSIDSKAIRSYVKSFYRQRCEAISPKPIPLMLRQGKGIVDMFSLNVNFSEEVLEAINSQSVEIMNAISGLSQVMLQLRKSTAEDQQKELSGNTYAP